MLRPYQQEQLDAVLKNYLEGTRRQLLVAATGTGKTVLFSNLPTKLKQVLPGKTLVTVHREKLVKQAYKAMQKWNPALKIGIEMGTEHADPDCDIIVSCVQSVGREGATRMLQHNWDTIDKIVVDEAHHSIADTYLRLLSESGVLQEGSSKLLLGTTATPKRKNRVRKDVVVGLPEDDPDMVSLKSVYQKIVHKYTIRQAIKEGWLVPIRGLRLKTDTDLSEVKSVAGDYNKDQLAETVNTGNRNLQVVKAWLSSCENRQTIVFTVDIKHAQDLAQEFRNAGVKAEAVWGTDEEQAKKISKFERGEIKVLCNCDLLTEGFDAWQIQCVVDAAPTKSSTRYTQKIGRGTRLEEGTGNLLEAMASGMSLQKRDCLVLDVCDNNKRCSLVTLPTLVGLNPDFDLHGESVTAAAEKVEALQEQNPGVDFSHLTDLSKIRAYVESLDLFAEPYDENIKEFSQLSWSSLQDGSYMLAIPEHRDIVQSRQFWNYKYEKLRLTPNELDEYVLSREANKEGTRILGTFNTLKEAFAIADDVVRRCRPDRMKPLLREAAWNNYPASDASKKYLKRLVGKRPFIYCTCPVGPNTSGVAGTTCGVCKKQQLTAGQVSIAITRFKVKEKI